MKTVALVGIGWVMGVVTCAMWMLYDIHQLLSDD